ncbi:MAG: patatin-like phospholipase family protein, partial [Candidatus Nanopelagicales bacterium]
MKIGLALGGGGITGGAFHAGVISALYSVGGWDARTAEVIIGTSAGSITATSLRVGLPPGDFLKRQTGEAMSPEGTTIIARVGTPNRSFQATSERSLRPANPDLLKAFARSPGSAHLGKIAAAALPEGTIPTDTIEHNMNALCQNDWPQPHPWITALR